MNLRLTPIAPVLLGVVSAQIALGIMTPLIPLMLLRQATPTGIIGLVASAYFAGFLLGALTADRIVTRVGHIRAFAVFAALAADATLMMALTRSPWAWALLRALLGFVMSGLFLVAESWLNDRAHKTTRGRVFGAYLVASWGGSAIGPLALNFVEGSAWLFVWAAIAFSTSLLPMALTQQANPRLGPRMRSSLAHLLRVSPLGVVVCITSGFTNSAFFALAPVYLERRGFMTGAVSVFISATMIAGLLVQYPIGMISDRLGRRPVTLAALFLGLAFALALGFSGRAPLALVIALGSLYAGMTAPLYGLGAGQTNDYIGPDQFVAASGGLLFAWSLGSSIGPAAAASVMTWLGPSGLFVYLAAILGGVGLFTIARMRLRAAVPMAQQSGFVPGPAAPARLPQLDPRSDPAAE